MTYLTALMVAQRAAEFLKDNDGNMSTGEMLVHAAALKVAADTVTAHLLGGK